MEGGGVTNIAIEGALGPQVSFQNYKCNKSKRRILALIFLYTRFADDAGKETLNWSA